MPLLTMSTYPHYHLYHGSDLLGYSKEILIPTMYHVHKGKHQSIEFGCKENGGSLPPMLASNTGRFNIVGFPKRSGIERMGWTYMPTDM